MTTMLGPASVASAGANALAPALIDPTARAIGASMPTGLPDLALGPVPSFDAAAPLADIVGADPTPLLAAAGELGDDRLTIEDTVRVAIQLISAAGQDIGEIGGRFLAEATPLLATVVAPPAALGALAQTASLASEALRQVAERLDQLERDLDPLVRRLETLVADAQARPDLVPSSENEAAAATLRELSGATETEAAPAPAADQGEVASPEPAPVPDETSPIDSGANSPAPAQFSTEDAAQDATGNSASPDAAAQEEAESDGEAEDGGGAVDEAPADDAPSTAGQAAVDAAKAQIGTPYVWGGSAPGGFDCSGLTSWAYQQAGVEIPRTAENQAVGRQVSFEELQPGDLVVWTGHVAMYAGDGMMVEAGDPVGMSPVRTTNIGMPFKGFWRPTG